MPVQSCPELARVEALGVSQDPGTQQALARLAAARPDVAVKYEEEKGAGSVTIPLSDCVQQ